MVALSASALAMKGEDASNSSASAAMRTEEGTNTAPAAVNAAQPAAQPAAHELVSVAVDADEALPLVAGVVARQEGALALQSVSAGARRRQLQQLLQMDEGELFMELIRDVANELDIDVLCHKILVNVGLLTRADRCSLFLARGPRDARYLVAKLFDASSKYSKLRSDFLYSEKKNIIDYFVFLLLIWPLFCFPFFFK
ncbi:cGMP-specific 3, partial [Gryllus bimaculatus]